MLSVFTITWRRPTLPHSLPCSTIGTVKLNRRVRNGNGCYLHVITTRSAKIAISFVSLRQIAPCGAHLRLVNSAPRSRFSLIYSLLSIFCCYFLCSETTCSLKIAQWIIFGQALDLLVSVSWTCYHAYTSDLSTLCSSRGLTSLRYGKSNLEVGFTLRCFQRLSRPDIATQLCSWRNNWCTRGQSIPVLSY